MLGRQRFQNGEHHSELALRSKQNKTIHDEREKTRGIVGFSPTKNVSVRSSYVDDDNNFVVKMKLDRSSEKAPLEQENAYKLEEILLKYSCPDLSEPSRQLKSTGLFSRYSDTACLQPDGDVGAYSKHSKGTGGMPKRYSSKSRSISNNKRPFARKQHAWDNDELSLSSYTLGNSPRNLTIHDPGNLTKLLSRFEDWSNAIRQYRDILSRDISHDVRSHTEKLYLIAKDEVEALRGLLEMYGLSPEDLGDNDITSYQETPYRQGVIGRTDARTRQDYTTPQLAYTANLYSSPPRALQQCMSDPSNRRSVPTGGRYGQPIRNSSTCAKKHQITQYNDPFKKSQLTAKLTPVRNWTETSLQSKHSPKSNVAGTPSPVGLSRQGAKAETSSLQIDKSFNALSRPVRSWDDAPLPGKTDMSSNSSTINALRNQEEYWTAVRARCRQALLCVFADKMQRENVEEECYQATQNLIAIKNTLREHQGLGDWSFDEKTLQAKYASKFTPSDNWIKESSKVDNHQGNISSPDLCDHPLHSSISSMIDADEASQDGDAHLDFLDAKPAKEFAKDSIKTVSNSQGLKPHLSKSQIRRRDTRKDHNSSSDSNDSHLNTPGYLSYFSSQASKEVVDDETSDSRFSAAAADKSAPERPTSLQQSSNDLSSSPNVPNSRMDGSSVDALLNRLAALGTLPGHTDSSLSLSSPEVEKSRFHPVLSTEKKFPVAKESRSEMKRKDPVADQETGAIPDKNDETYLLADDDHVDHKPSQKSSILERLKQRIHNSEQDNFPITDQKVGALANKGDETGAISDKPEESIESQDPFSCERLQQHSHDSEQDNDLDADISSHSNAAERKLKEHVKETATPDARNDALLRSSYHHRSNNDSGPVRSEVYIVRVRGANVPQAPEITELMRSQSIQSSCSQTDFLHCSDLGPAVVIDNGSGMIKAGLANNENPTVVMPNIVGVPQYKVVMNHSEQKSFYVGREALQHRGMLKINYPLRHGIVENWDNMEKVWHELLYNELRVEPSEHPILMTEAPLNPMKNRERMIEIMMEIYQVPAFYVAIQATLALYGSGRTTGVVFDSGDGVSHVVPVYEGYSLPFATQRIDIGGHDVTEHLMRIITERGYSFTTSAEKEICRDIKENLCFVADDYVRMLEESDKTAAFDKEYMLPDGNVVTIGNERFRAPELLFQPSMLGKDDTGIHEKIYTAVQKCDVDIRSSMFKNVILSGGTTMFPGFQQRLAKELSCLLPNGSDQLNIVADPERKLTVWRGGAALADLSVFINMCVTSDEYEECGPAIVHRKCF